MIIRKEGFYWVKYTHEWLIAHWEDGEWSLWYAHGKLKDVNFDEIDERIITRQST